MEDEEEKPKPKKEKKAEDEVCDIPKSKNNFVDQISKDAVLGDGIENDTDYEDAIIEFTSSSFGEANGIIRDFKLEHKEITKKAYMGHVKAFLPKIKPFVDEKRVAGW